MSFEDTLYKEHAWAKAAAEFLYNQTQDEKPSVFLKVQLFNPTNPNHQGIRQFNQGVDWVRLNIYFENKPRFLYPEWIETYVKNSIEAFINNSVMFYDEENYLGPVDLSSKYTADKVDNIDIIKSGQAVYLTATYNGFGPEGSYGVKIKKKIKL